MKPKTITSILLKPTLSKRDIALLDEVSEGTAKRIMARCRLDYGGTVIMNRALITTESYLQYCGYPKGTWAEIFAKTAKESED